MRSFRYVALLAFTLAALSACGRKTVVEGSFNAAPASGIVVAKTIDGSAMSVLDTIRLKGNGFRYAPDIKEGQPEFVYLYCNEVKVASLLLSRGDRVKVECDTLGASWTVSGSEDCEKLLKNEMDYAAFANAPEITAQDYISFYRKSMKYVMNNAKSLTVIPVLFSKVGGLHVFGQISDALVFNTIADSLETVYPDSRYLKMLRAEAKTRSDRMALENMLQKANVADFPELKLPNERGRKVALSESLGEKATLVLFWDASQPLTKMFNLEVMKPLYDEYSSRGLNIYAVNVNADKATWAMVVKEQKLPWVNVCDITGQSALLYGITAEPTAVLIHGNKVDRLTTTSLAGLRKAVGAAL